MIISTFFDSYAGMYVAQSFCHSLVAAVVAERAIKAWSIDDPLSQQRFHLIAVLFPIFSFPFYQAVNSGRSSPVFRLDALFDVNRWLGWEIGGVPAGLLFLVLLTITSLVYVFQETIPVLRHLFELRNMHREGSAGRTAPFVEEASRMLSIVPPEVTIIDDDEPVIFSTTGRLPVILLSTGLRESFTEAQFHAAMAHELAHIARSRRPLLVLVFILRAAMFFNPVALIKFRRTVRDEEKICDDIAVSLTGDPKALAEALGKFYHHPGTPAGLSLEDHSHNLHLESRIRRLEGGAAGAAPEKRTAPFALTLLVIAVINYFVV